MSDRTVPPFHGNISFNAQHSPMGAFFSFTCGQFGSRGGFGLQIGQPGNQNLYVGVKDGDRFSDAPLKCLPFFEGATSDGAAAFQVEQADPTKARPQVDVYKASQIKRHFGWAIDRWVTPDLEFAIYTPLHGATEPKKPLWIVANLLLPAVAAELTIDNTSGTTTKTGVFAMTFPTGGVRMLDREPVFETGSSTGFMFKNEIAVEGTVHVLNPDGSAGSVTTMKAFPVCRWSVADSLKDPNPVHLLGNTPGIGFEVPPGQKYTLRLVFAVYLGNPVTTGIEGRYGYTRAFNNVLNVVDATDIDAIKVSCERSDEELLASNLSPDQQFMIAHATRSYYGSTQLLDVGGEPFWIVNEGEYCMMNTLDLSVDHVFWELKQNPWVVKNLLDNFVRHYSYVDQVKKGQNGDQAGAPSSQSSVLERQSSLTPGGISFCHDMGVHNNFSPKGNSSYELPNLNAACFSYMTAEQLCNWILIAASYVSKTNDLDWAGLNAHVIEACFTSLKNRCDANGFPAYDSSRCGPGGAEITTYDSLDHSLAQTRNNLYMVVKAWASFRGLELLFDELGSSLGEDANAMAMKIEKELPKRAGEDGVFPAVFEKENTGWSSRILPAAEGLMYPLYWGTLASSPFVEALKKHTVVLLQSGTNIFADGGIKLSSTSNNSWMSKIAIFMHVCRKVFKLDEDPAIAELFRKADAAHVKWQTEGESAYWACSDQFVNGVAKGSKYYPRIITAALWME